MLRLINIEHLDKSSRQAELSVALEDLIEAENPFRQKNLHQIVYKESFLVMNADRDLVRNHCESHFFIYSSKILFYQYVYARRKVVF